MAKCLAVCVEGPAHRTVPSPDSPLRLRAMACHLVNVVPVFTSRVEAVVRTRERAGVLQEHPHRDSDSWLTSEGNRNTVG